MAETYQEGVSLPFEGHVTKTQKWPNTEPQGVPETLDRFFGKLILFFTIPQRRQWLKLTKKGYF